MDLSLLDMSIIVLYFIGVLYHGWHVSKKHNASSDYFLAGRALPWHLIGLSLYASNMSGSSFIGLIGATYANGMVVFNYEWTATLVLLFFAIFMLPPFLRHKISTIPEFLERRFDRRTRTLFSGFTILAIIFIDAAGALYAGGLVLTLLFPLLELWQAVVILGLVAGIYTLWGGLSAVVVTDAVQAVLLIIAGIIIFFVGLDAVGGWDALWQRVPMEKTELIKPMDDSFLPWPGIGGVILLGFYYWTLNQFIAQRSLGARSIEDGQKGAYFAGVLKLGNVFIMIIPGLIALVLFPDLESPDHAFPTLVAELLPIGIKGIVLAGLIAAIMSSLDSALAAGASLITLDFIQPIRGGDADAREYMTIGRIVTAIIMVIAICYAPTIARFETIFDYFQSSLAYTVPAIASIYAAGLFTTKVPPLAAKTVLLGGMALGVLLFIATQLTGWADAAGLPQVHYTVMALWLFGGQLMLLLVWGALRPMPGAADDPLEPHA